jgi:hypothetical protein
MKIDAEFRIKMIIGEQTFQIQMMMDKIAELTAENEALKAAMAETSVATKSAGLDLR